MRRFFTAVSAATAALFFAVSSVLADQGRVPTPWVAEGSAEGRRSSADSAPEINWLLNSDSYVTAIDFSGPGSAVGALPANYDISLLELGWGGKQALFNGSGITTNTAYPLAEGVAVTTQDQFGASVKLPRDDEVGILWQVYAAGGSRTVARTYGAQIPWDNVERKDERVLVPNFENELARAWIKGAGGPLAYQLTGGNLDALEFTRSEQNFLNLASLLYRPPVTTSSYFGKGDRRFQPGRHVMKGADAVGSWEYAEEKRLKSEIFFGITKPTPVQEIDRATIGGRLSADVLDGNVAATYVQLSGERNPSITGERETLWALDGSYNFLDWLAAYGIWAHTGYHRNTRLHGNAWVSGLRLLGWRKSEWRAQYQYVGENYELMGYHKIEHYPSNFHGVNASVSIPAGPASIKGLIYRLHQIETNTHAGDTLFGDSYFPAIVQSERGDITAFRIAGEYDLGGHQEGLPKIGAYLEQAHFQKDAPDSGNNDIDKRVSSWELYAVQPVLAGLTVEGGCRLVTASGRWQAMRFHHRQVVPEAALVYRIKDEKEKDRFRAALIYHHYDFTDSIAASSGRNNYSADQMIAEVFWTF